MKKQIRVGVVGVGNIGSAHAKAIYNGEIEGAVLAAVCDTNPARDEYLRDRFPSVPIYRSAEDLFASGLIDAVVVATPHYAHPTVAIAAFRAGLHVLSEKPMAVYGLAAREMLDAAKKSGKLFAVMLQQRTNGLFQKARELVQSGALGELKRAVWIVTNWYRKQKYYDSGDWRATWSGEGGGVLMNQAPHNLDLWQWITGMPVEIWAQCDEGKYHDITVEDDATVFARYANGATGCFITTTGEYPGTNRLEIAGSRGKIVIEGGKLTHTALEIDEREFCKMRNSVENAETVTVWEEEANDRVGHTKVLSNFVRAICDGEPLIATGEEAANELAICNAAYLSAWTGERVRLPMDDERYFALLSERIARETPREHQATDEKLENLGEYHSRWSTKW